MALKFGRRLVAHSSQAGNPISIGSITVVAGEVGLILSLKVVGATDRAGGSPTLGSFTFTSRNSPQKAAASPEAGIEHWELLNVVEPGTYTLTVPNTGALTVFVELDTITSEGGSIEFEASAGANATGTNPSPGAVTRSSWPGNFSYAATAGGWQTWAPSAQVGTAIHNTDDGAHGCGRQYLEGGVGTLTLSWTFATSEDYGAIVATYREVPPVALNNYALPAVVGVASMQGSG